MVKDYYNIGDIIFLTKLETINTEELVIQIDSIKDNIISASRIILFNKDIDEKTGQLSLTPLNNSLMISNIVSTDNTEVFDVCPVYFNIDRFDISGIVENVEILNIFKQIFEPDKVVESTKPKRKRVKNVILGSEYKGEE